MLGETGLIIFGVILLIIGIIFVLYWNFSLDKVLDNEDTSSESVIMLPYKTINSTVEAPDLERPIVLAIHSNSSKARMEEKITDPIGTVLNNNKFSKEFVTAFLMLM